MFGWLSNWWADGTVYGPARNAPSELIKAILLGQNQFVNVSQADIVSTQSKLKHVETRTNRSEFEYPKDSPMFELHEIFKKGINNHLRNKCTISEKTTITITHNNTDGTNENDNTSESNETNKTDNVNTTVIDRQIEIVIE